MPHHRGGLGSCTKGHTRVVDQALCENGFESFLALDKDLSSMSQSVKDRELLQQIALFGFSLLGWDMTFGPDDRGQPVCGLQHHWDVADSALIRRMAIERCLQLLDPTSRSSDQTSELLKSFFDVQELADFESKAQRHGLMPSDLDSNPWNTVRRSKSFLFNTADQELSTVSSAYRGLKRLLMLKIAALRNEQRQTHGYEQARVCNALESATQFGIDKLNAAEISAILLLTQGWTDLAGVDAWARRILHASSSREWIDHRLSMFKAVLPTSHPNPSSHAHQAERSLAKSVMSIRKLRLYGFA
ncbi:hypothetical protein ACM66B_005353 [Microbotryomycetes sp. NB124-2]